MKVSEYPTASSLALSDIIYVVAGGLSRKATFTQVQALIGGGGNGTGNVTSPLSGNLSVGNNSITGYTGNRAIESDGNGALQVSSVTRAELGYLSGVTSAVQTQLNAKASDADLTLAEGNISALQSQMTANAGNITTLQGNTTAQQAMITALQGNDTDQQTDIGILLSSLSAAEGNIASLQGNLSDLTLSDLTDVDTAGATIGQVLLYDGTGNWTPGNQTGGSGNISTQVIGNLANVDVSAATDLQVLTYHSGNDTWMAETPSGGNATTPGGGNQSFQFNDNGVFAGNNSIYFEDVSGQATFNSKVIRLPDGGTTPTNYTSFGVLYFDSGMNCIIDAWGPDSSTPGKIIMRGISNNVSIVNTGIIIDIDGVQIWGAYKLPTTAGSAGDVLTSNGDGTTSWVAP